MIIKDIPDGNIPYLKRIDLIVYKIYSCGLRSDTAKSQIDAMDAETLLKKEVESNGRVVLQGTQLSHVHNSLPAILQYSNNDKKWWMINLGLVESVEST